MRAAARRRSGPTSSPACPARPRARCSATSRTSTPCSPSPEDWSRDPWSGELHDGFVWGRGALDMKSQTAAEVVAGGALAREGWRPPRGELKIISVADEEVGGLVGAQWLTQERPDLARVRHAAQRGRRAGHPLRRPPPLRRLLRREGDVPVRGARRRPRRPRLRPRARRQRAAQAGPVRRAPRRRRRDPRPHRPAARVPVGGRARPAGPGRRARDDPRDRRAARGDDRADVRRRRSPRRSSRRRARSTSSPHAPS